MIQAPNTNIVFKVKLENVYFEVEETNFKSKETAIGFLTESQKNDFYVKSELVKEILR
jgi:hypothetical protein